MDTWCRFGVAGEIAWPREQAIVEFGKWELLAFPSTKDHEPSLQIELLHNRTDEVGARSICNQLLSICSWCDDSPAALMDGGCGSPKASPLPRDRRSHHLTSILDNWPYNRAPLADTDQQLAVALYREALWQNCYASIPYAALGFFKILEIRQSGACRKKWMKLHLPQGIEQGEFDDFYVKYFLKAAEEQNLEPAKYLYENCRNAVAHATEAPIINPDDVQQVRDLSACTPILRALARCYIRDDLDVAESHWEG
ncbi:MAG: methylamine utilization protein MauJ [Alphaproteobacteria bacterium]